ncbi:MAG TPA: NAD(P)-dependent oxidoreductase [Bacilli bacterium]|nr:NAD(P)-dependent oxidoreductase [Bacilli bacterium]
MNEILVEDALQIIEENDGLIELFGCNFLITGASGMVGRSFLNTLLVLNDSFNANINVYVLVRNSSKLPQYVVENPNVHIIVQDVIEPIVLTSKMDYIVHAAGPASPTIMRENPVGTNFANTLGTANTLMYAIKSSAKAYLFISSREIYGQPDEGQEIFREDGRYGQVDQLVPRNSYAEGKKAAENMCCSFKQQYGLNTKIVRLAHTYGPGMSIYDGRVQADFLKNIVSNQNIELKSEGSSVRTYTYISDATSAMFKILLHSKDIVYNVADENCKTSIRELAQTLINIYPDRGLRLTFNIPNSTQRLNSGCATFTDGILSTQKIRDELQWIPKYSISDGFKRTIDYLESEQGRVLKKKN